MPTPAVAVAIRTRHADEAEALGSQFLYPQRLDLLDASAQLDLTMFAGRIGPIFLSDCHYATDVRIACGELATSYHVNIPLSGHLLTTQGRCTVVATPSTAAVYGPQGDTILDNWSSDCRQLCVKIEKSALERTLTDQTGQRIDRPIPLEPTIDLRDGPGRDWAELVMALNKQLHRADGLVHHPLVAAPLAESLLNGLLAATHQLRDDELDALAAPDRPRLVTQAIEFMHEHAAEPLTTSSIAAHCCVSVRALQVGFQKHVGHPPLQHLRAIRLRRAHEDLVLADPYEESVASIAHRWGFSHLGRFSAAHNAAFGEPPSKSLRRGL